MYQQQQKNIKILGLWLATLQHPSNWPYKMLLMLILMLSYLKYIEHIPGTSSQIRTQNIFVSCQTSCGTTALQEFLSFFCISEIIFVSDATIVSSCSKLEWVAAGIMLHNWPILAIRNCIQQWLYFQAWGWGRTVCLHMKGVKKKRL